MKRFSTAPLLGASLIAIGSLLAACGGGGGGGATPPVNSGGGSSPGGSSPPGSTASPPATPPPSASGQVTLAGNALANAIVVFTCGCSGEAGEVHSDANGNFSITVPATAVPASPVPYTPPGHNLMIVGYQPGGHGQTWTMEFFGSTPAHNLNLAGTSGPNVADVYTTAAALYIYYETVQYYNNSSNTDRTYDIWNFNNIASFEQSLRAHGGNNAAEQKLIADITTAQSSGASLYPAIPSWDPTTGDSVDGPIGTDIGAVANSGDPALPQICGTSCAGAPTP